MRNQVCLAMAGAIALSGCASRSSEITPTYVSPIQYQSYTCPQLAEEAQRVSAAAAAAAGVQDKQRTDDAVATTVAVVLFWPAAFLVGGDKQNAAQLAQLKGQFDAIQQEAIRKNCGIRFEQAAAPGQPAVAYAPAPEPAPAAAPAPKKPKAKATTTAAAPAPALAAPATPGQ